MSVQRSFSLFQAFSLNKQSDLVTDLSTPLTSIDRNTPMRAFVPTVPENPNIISDGAWFGKGNSFATFFDPITRRYIMGSREYSMTDLTALFACAFVFGAVATTQPNSATDATVFDHKFTFKDPASDPNCVSTGFIEKIGSEGQHMYSGVVLDGFTMTGKRDDHVTIGWQAHARKKASNSTTLPALSAASFFKTLFATFSFGAAGSAATVSGEVLDFTFAANQNPDWLWLPGATAGTETLASKVLIGRQQASGSLRMFVDATRLALFENVTECELTIACVGPTITNAYKHTVTIKVPHFQISNMTLNEEGSTIAMQMEFSADSVLKATSADYCSVTVRTTEDATKLLVNA